MKCHYCRAKIEEEQPGWGFRFDDVTGGKTYFHNECLQINEDVVLA